MKALTTTLLPHVIHLYVMVSITQGTSTPRCTLPRVFEGRFNVTVESKGYTGDIIQDIGRGSVHVDAKNGRAAIVEEAWQTLQGSPSMDDVLSPGGRNTRFSILISKVDKAVYYTFPALQVCEKGTLQLPVLPDSVPKDATLSTTHPLVDVPLQVWRLYLRQGKLIDTVRMYLEEVPCLPAVVDLRLTVDGQSVNVTERLYDMREGVKDANVFTVPDYCTQQRYIKRAKSITLDKYHEWHRKHAVARRGARGHLFV